jgi:transcriptional regulator with XRE-family HTH domain
MAVDTLGERIRKLRMERGMSLAKVAGGDFSRAFLNQVELGKSQPSMRVLRVIASRLDAPFEYLLEGEQRFLDREVALEKGRLAVARRNPRKALADLEPVLDSQDWPAGTDARLTAAEALLALGRGAEAYRLLGQEEPEIRRRGDTVRLRRLRAIRARQSYSVSAPYHVRLAEAAMRDGRVLDGLDHYRSARVMFEAARTQS